MALLGYNPAWESEAVAILASWVDALSISSPSPMASFSPSVAEHSVPPYTPRIV